MRSCPFLLVLLCLFFPVNSFGALSCSLLHLSSPLPPPTPAHFAYGTYQRVSSLRRVYDPEHAWSVDTIVRVSLCSSLLLPPSSPGIRGARASAYSREPRALCLNNEFLAGEHNSSLAYGAYERGRDEEKSGWVPKSLFLHVLKHVLRVRTLTWRERREACESCKNNIFLSYWPCPKMDFLSLCTFGLV